MRQLPPAYGGEILHVDLGTKRTTSTPLDPDVARKYLGGNGLAAKLVHDHVPDTTAPYDPANVVACTVGPMTGTVFHSTSRGVLGFISPMTNGFFDSTFGGTFPQAQKSTGFDAIVLHGKADDLSYVVVDEDGAQIRSADDLSGTDTYETCASIRERETGDYSTHVLAAGPAAEHRVRYACLLHDGRDREGVAGRGGSGAVLASKNVKALAIREGSFRPDVVDEAQFRDLVFEQLPGLMEDTELLQNYGTSGVTNPINEMGKLGQRNNQYEQAPPEMVEEISGERFKDEYVTEDTTCAGCAVKCGKHVSVESAGITQAKIPEFETLFGVATMQEVYDADVAIEVSDLCDRLGMDTISWGVTVAFARECYERGLYDGDESPALEFGNAEGLIDLVTQTAHREGIGDDLADGSFELVERLDDEAVHYLHGRMGLEFAGHSPRGLKGMSIGYATSNRGGSHHDTRPTRQYGGEYAEATDGAAEFAARSQHYTALGDSLTQCRFVSEGGWGADVNDRYRDAIRYGLGWDLTVEETERIGERIYNLERLISVNRGAAGREVDTLPHRVMTEPIPEGPSKGMYCPPEELETMRSEYYEYRGWDESGEPTADTLDRLGVER